MSHVVVHKRCINCNATYPGEFVESCEDRIAEKARQKRFSEAFQKHQWVIDPIDFDSRNVTITCSVCELHYWYWGDGDGDYFKCDEFWQKDRLLNCQPTNTGAEEK